MHLCLLYSQCFDFLGKSVVHFCEIYLNSRKKEKKMLAKLKFANIKFILCHMSRSPVVYTTQKKFCIIILFP